MYRVTAGALTDEQCRAITSYLYKDTPAYEMPQNRPVTLKADVQREIERLTRAQAAERGETAAGFAASAAPVRVPWK